MTIRTEHRIVGKLVGSTVKWPRNSSLYGKYQKIMIKRINCTMDCLLGLPAIYSPYETQLLIDKQIIQLRKKTFSDVPNETMEKLYEERCEDQIKAYHEIYMEKRADDAIKLMDKILAGKRKKVAKSGGDPSTVTEDTILEDVRKRAIQDVTNVFIQVPTQEPFEVG